MISIKETEFYSEVRKVISVPYGDFYLFDHFVVSEIHEGVTFSWEEHAKPIVLAISEYYNNTGGHIVYISNRINNYSVKPVDWLLFFKYSFKLAGYAIISNSEKGFLNAKLESLFIRSKFKAFDNFYDAVQWAAAIQYPQEV